MKAQILNLENKAVGEIGLDDKIFALTPRGDIIKLVIDWQRAKAMAGTHQTKTISEVSGTTRKPFKQKGTGNARQGSLRSVQMRGGGISHGPVTRSHATKLPKKIRRLGLKHALSAKLSEGKLLIIDSLQLTAFKTASLVEILKNFPGRSFFIVDGNIVNENLLLASRNIYNAVVVPQIGINVYDVVKHDYVLLSQAALNALEERLR